MKELPEGTLVKLDYKKLCGQPNWDRLNPAYTAWVESHKNSILTVQYDNKPRKNHYLVTFKEITEEPRWLFAVDDLIVVE